MAYAFERRVMIVIGLLAVRDIIMHTITIALLSTRCCTKAVWPRSNTFFMLNGLNSNTHLHANVNRAAARCGYPSQQSVADGGGEGRTRRRVMIMCTEGRECLVSDRMDSE